MLEKIIIVLLILNYPIIKKIFYVSYGTPQKFSESMKLDYRFRGIPGLLLFFIPEYNQRRLSESRTEIFILLVCLLIGVEMALGYIAYIIFKFYAEHG